MKLSFQALAFILISILFATCKQDDELSYDTTFGSIFITVKHNGDVVPNANVITNPETGIFQTDFLGTTLIKDVDPATYQITALHPDYGNGIETAIVNVGQLTSVDIELAPGNVPNPTVIFISPNNGATIDIDVAAEFSIIVSDDSDSPQNINLEWTSDVDGLLSTASASPNGTAVISVADLSEGDHVIQVIATDSDGFVGGASVGITVQDIPNSVTLSPLQGLASGIQLNWTTSDEPTFSSYKIYQSVNNNSNFQVIETIEDINNTSYTDNNLVVGNSYYYRIGLTLSDGEERLSNTQFLAYDGVTIYVGTQVEKMIVDPNRPFIYAIDRVNNALLFVDLNLGALTKTVLIGLSPVDMDLSLDGDKLYIANFGSTQINVINLNEQEIDFSFFVDTDVGTWDGNPYRFAVLSNNRVAFVSEDQFSNIKIVDATTGVNILFGETVDEPNLFTDPSGNILYVAESSSTGSQLLRYDVSGNSLNQVDESTSVAAWERSGFITFDGQYIFFRRQKILANNLQSVLGTFPEEVYASNANGSIVLGGEQYYDGNTFAILGTLPVSSTVIAADPNNDVFYIYDEENSNIVLLNP